MSRDAKVAVVEAFFRCIVEKDLERLPVEPDFTTESPLTPKRRGPAAIEYLRGVAAGMRAIRIEQHIVEGDWVATLFVEDTVHGELTVFSRFHVVGDRIRDVIVFYDPRRIVRAT